VHDTRDDVQEGHDIQERTLESAFESAFESAENGRYFSAHRCVFGVPTFLLGGFQKEPVPSERPILVDLLDRNARHTDSLPRGYFDAVLEGQAPPLVSLCCSDSRVPQAEM